MDAMPMTQDAPTAAFAIFFMFAFIFLVFVFVFLGSYDTEWKKGTDVVPWWAPKFADVPVTPGTLYWNWADEHIARSVATLDLLAIVVTRHKNTAPIWFKDTSILPAVRLGAMLWRLPGNTIPPWRCIDAGEMVFHNDALLANDKRVDDYHKGLAAIYSALFDGVFDKDEIDDDYMDQIKFWRYTMEANCA